MLLQCVFVYAKLHNQNCPHQNSSTATQSTSALIHAYIFLGSQKHNGTYFLALFTVAPCIQKHYLLFIIYHFIDIVIVSGKVCMLLSVFC